jgi:signal transduction histidine kinase
LTALVDGSVKDVRKSAASQQQVFPVAAFIADVRDTAQLEAGARGCKFSVEAVDPALGLRADRGLLLAAVANLLQNAFKFTQPGTEVKLTATASLHHVLIEVSDHCGGLPPGSAAAMFTPFHQRSDDKSGLGLGLSIARQGIEADAGTLAVRDMPGVGCVFTIRLPRHPI